MLPPRSLGRVAFQLQRFFGQQPEIHQISSHAKQQKFPKVPRQRIAFPQETSKQAIWYDVFCAALAAASYCLCLSGELHHHLLTQPFLQPRKAHNPVDDPEITIRLKHGIHTVFLLVMLDWPFSRVATELLSVLQDRYPEGLTTSIAPPETTVVPTSDRDVKVAYALPKNPNDISQGWKNIKAQPTDTVGSKGLADMSSVAFALLDTDADGDNVKFQVEVPALDDEES